MLNFCPKFGCTKFTISQFTLGRVNSKAWVLTKQNPALFYRFSMMNIRNMTRPLCPYSHSGLVEPFMYKQLQNLCSICILDELCFDGQGIINSLHELVTQSGLQSQKPVTVMRISAYAQPKISRWPNKRIGVVLCQEVL